MAAIDELIQQIQDPTLRDRIQKEVNKMAKQKKFGLVFEEHLPECTPLYDMPIYKGTKVAKKTGKVDDIYIVLDFPKDGVLCKNVATKEDEVIPNTELVAVAEFGEAIYPYLKPIDTVCNAPDSELWHTLIEADNYHALQLLEYLYAGKVDCIYIDPPYNTGARDWKYNNDYVDSSDMYRHSKWLSFMEKRLVLAKKILNPDTGVLIVTIDEHEVHHLRTLLEQIFPEFYIQMCIDVINPKGVAQGRFSRVEEYDIYCFAPNAFVANSNDNLLNPVDNNRKPRWKGLLRSGTNARREDRKNMFYPIYIDTERRRVHHVGESLPYPEEPDFSPVDGYDVAWPIRTDGSYGNWGVGFESFQKLVDKGYVSVGNYDKKRKTWSISYISLPNQKKIETGDIIVTGRDEVSGTVDIAYSNLNNRAIKTVWHRSSHDAGAYGTDLLSNFVDRNRAFSFPKSLYTVRDALNAVLRNNPNALVVDFFAGSGTTMHAVNLMNYEDGGTRRCVLVTNNELSQEDASELVSLGCQPGDPEWEEKGIAHSVTWPRTKNSIIGRKDNGDLIDGNYGTSHEGFVLVEDELNYSATGKPYKKKCYIHNANLPDSEKLSDLKYSDGFKTNAAFFKLGFLNKNAVALGTQFKELLPVLWMKSGCVGPCPELKDDTLPEMLVLPENRFAVLLEDYQFADFERQLAETEGIDTVYIVTDSEAGYKDMIRHLNVKNTYQLYRDYLDNFRINVAR